MVKRRFGRAAKSQQFAFKGASLIRFVTVVRFASGDRQIRGPIAEGASVEHHVIHH
jgi:hypothetical protein